MANPQKGEVGFEVGGKSYILKLGTYAQAALERRVKMPFQKFITRGNDEFGVDDTLALVWAGLFRQHHLTEEQVADIIDDLGDERLTEILAEAVRVALGVQEDKGSRPPPAEANGTGKSS